MPHAGYLFELAVTSRVLQIWKSYKGHPTRADERPKMTQGFVTARVFKLRSNLTEVLFHLV